MVYEKPLGKINDFWNLDGLVERSPTPPIRQVELKSGDTTPRRNFVSKTKPSWEGSIF